MAQAESLMLKTELLGRAVQGDTRAFSDIVHRHQRMVFSIAWHFFHDPALAEDLSQDVFLHLYQNLGALESEAHLLFWLRQVTTRKCIDHARTTDPRRNLCLDDVGEFAAPAAAADVLESDRLRRFVAALPERFRAIVILRFQEDMAPAEIAKVLACPLNTVKSRLHRALKLLRQRLEK